MKVTVIGLGAMGGGMARALLRSPAIKEVAGFDLSRDLVSKFYAEAKEANKAAGPEAEAPTDLSLQNFVNIETDVVLIVLVNESDTT